MVTLALFVPLDGAALHQEVSLLVTAHEVLEVTLITGFVAVPIALKDNEVTETDKLEAAAVLKLISLPYEVPTELIA